MRKLVLMVAMLAMVLSVTVPAIAQDQDIDESGDVNQSSEISNSGDNSNQCAAPQQVGNTGSVQNAQGFSQGQQQDDGLGDAALLDALSDFDFGEDVEFSDVASLFDDLSGDNVGNGGGFEEASFEGPSFEMSPSQAVECNQVVDQDATALSTY
jgi:hypothetical protein